LIYWSSIQENRLQRGPAHPKRRGSHRLVRKRSEAPAPNSVRAGAHGALLLYVSRTKLRQLLDNIPALRAMLDSD